MKSPFKFLDAYAPEDKDIFFGREKEIDALYNMVYKTPLVMVYGLSGTGKTSLVQGGLAKRFDGPDWLPFLIRKEENINDSLRKLLQQDLPINEHHADLKIIIERLFYKYFRPVYLLFDQFEELFILGSREEQMQFMNDIQKLQEAELPCRIVFILREEYIGQLYEFEKLTPSLFDYKLRVEPMTNKYIRQVMTQSFAAFNLELESPVEDRLDQMVEKLSAGKSNIPLPYLQVYLDMLYQKVYKKAYPKGSNEDLPHLKITKSIIDDFGEIDDVLNRFLSEKKIEIQESLLEKESTLSKDTVKNVLDVFVTEEGTKRPIFYQRKDQEIVLEKSIREKLSFLSEKHLSFCLLELEKARLIRFRDDTVELAHDTLAALIDQQRSGEQRKLNEMRREIKSSYKVYEQTGDFLTLGQLELYQPFLASLNLNQEVKTFFGNSQNFHEDEKKRKAEELFAEKELRKTAEKNETTAKNRTRLASIASMIAMLVAVAAIFFFQNARKQEKIAKQQEQIAEEKTQVATLAKNEADSLKNVAVESLDLAKKNEEEAKAAKQETDAAIVEIKYQKSQVEKNATQLELSKNQAEEKKVLAEREAILIKAQEAILKNRNKEAQLNLTQLQIKNQQTNAAVRIKTDSIFHLKTKLDSLSKLYKEKDTTRVKPNNE